MVSRLPKQDFSPQYSQDASLSILVAASCPSWSQGHLHRWRDRDCSAWPAATITSQALVLGKKMSFKKLCQMSSLLNRCKCVTQEFILKDTPDLKKNEPFTLYSWNFALFYKSWEQVSSCPTLSYLFHQGWILASGECSLKVGKACVLLCFIWMLVKEKLKKKWWISKIPLKERQKQWDPEPLGNLWIDRVTRTEKRERTIEWLSLDSRVVFFFSPFSKFSTISRKGGWESTHTSANRTEVSSQAVIILK